MTPQEIQTLRDLPIESVAERLGLEVKRHKALCPYHEDVHPSLSFRSSTNSFKCFVCSAHGGTIDLAMHVLGKSFKETCDWLANEHNVIIEKYQPAVKEVKHYPPDIEFLSGLVRYPVLNDEAKHFLFEQRKLNPKVIEWCGISSISYPTPCWRYGRPFYDAPSLLFPYKDINGKVLNVQSRYLGDCIACSDKRVADNSLNTKHSTLNIPRFRFPPNGAIHIFNLPILRYLKPNEPLYISEGITDCLALLSSGKRAIAIPSSTLLKPSDLEIAKGHEWRIFPDKDAAGERLYQQLVKVSLQLGTTLIRQDLPEGCKDYSEYYVSTR